MRFCRPTGADDGLASGESPRWTLVAALANVRVREQLESATGGELRVARHRVGLDERRSRHVRSLQLIGDTSARASCGPLGEPRLMFVDRLATLRSTVRSAGRGAPRRPTRRARAERPVVMRCDGDLRHRRRLRGRRHAGPCWGRGTLAAPTRSPSMAANNSSYADVPNARLEHRTIDGLPRARPRPVKQRDQSGRSHVQPDDGIRRHAAHLQRSLVGIVGRMRFCRPTGHRARSTKAGVRTPATPAPSARRPSRQRAPLNEGRGSNPGDTMQAACPVAQSRQSSFAQRRPGFEPRRHPRSAAVRRQTHLPTCAQRRPGFEPRRHPSAPLSALSN